VAPGSCIGFQGEGLWAVERIVARAWLVIGTRNFNGSRDPMLETELENGESKF
jgi:hypothetical protein